MVEQVQVELGSPEVDAKLMSKGAQSRWFHRRRRQRTWRRSARAPY
jgi:hypothetical protein